MHCNHAHGGSIEQQQIPEPGPEDAYRALEQGLKHGVKVARRTRDHLKNLRGRRLLLQGFAQIIGEVPQLFQQPGVLDGDDRLGREILDQLDLLAAEWSRLLSENHD